jgi:hypothetical protein
MTPIDAEGGMDCSFTSYAQGEQRLQASAPNATSAHFATMDGFAVRARAAASTTAPPPDTHISASGL